MFGLFGQRTRVNPFAACVRRLNAGTAAHLLELDEDDNTAFFCFPGSYEDYILGMALHPGGRVTLRVLSETYWIGRPPAVIYGFMGEIDRGNPRVSFSVDTFSSGKSRCAAACLGPVPERFGAELFLDAAAELIGAMAGVDRTLRQRGYA